MKIGQVAPLMESVPPRLYGGTERIVSYLTEELVRMGHEVTLFASGDSIASAQLLGCVPTALRLDANVHDPIPYYLLMLDRVRDAAEDFDIVHFHIDQFHFPLFKSMASRTVTTLHGRQDIPDLKPLYLGFPNMPLVSISGNPVPTANFVATVLHGIPSHLYTPIFTPRAGYVAFLGRISPEKRPDRAIRIAQRLGVPLKIAAKVDRADEAYFREQIEPMLQQPGVEFIGEINERAKTKFLGEARALLFPVDWPEPFGIVMIEAMACGTPVLAFRRGSVPEIVDNGVTGQIVDTEEEAVIKSTSGSLARSPRSAPALRGTVLRHAHGEGLHSDLSFAHEKACTTQRCRFGHQRGAPAHGSERELIRRSPLPRTICWMDRRLSVSPGPRTTLKFSKKEYLNMPDPTRKPQNNAKSIDRWDNEGGAPSGGGRSARKRPRATNLQKKAAAKKSPKKKAQWPGKRAISSS